MESERLFSQVGLVLTKLRSKLLPKNFEILTFLKAKFEKKVRNDNKIDYLELE